MGMGTDLVGVPRHTFHVDTVNICVYITKIRIMSQEERKLDRLKMNSEGATEAPTCAVFTFNCYVLPLHSSRANHNRNGSRWCTVMRKPGSAVRRHSRNWPWTHECGLKVFFWLLFWVDGVSLRESTRFLQSSVTVVQYEVWLCRRLGYFGMFSDIARFHSLKVGLVIFDFYTHSCRLISKDSIFAPNFICGFSYAEHALWCRDIKRRALGNYFTVRMMW